MKAVEQLAHALESRGDLDLTEASIEASAALIWDAGALAPAALLHASAVLLPFAMRARHKPASALIAAVFPNIYKELRERPDIPSFLGFFVFVDWDRCKTARQDLVDAFLTSDWQPVHLALAAARAGDPDRILGQLVRRRGGEDYLLRIERDLPRIPLQWRDRVAPVIRDLVSS